MTRATTKNVNEAIADQGLELIKGEGYFCFSILPGFPDEIKVPESVYVTRIRDLSLEEWVEAATIEEEEEIDLTNNEKAAIVVFINSCLSGMGGEVPEDLNADPYTWVGVDDLVEAGWPLPQAKGTMGSLTAKGVIFENDKDAYCLTDDFGKIFPIWHEAEGDHTHFQMADDEADYPVVETEHGREIEYPGSDEISPKEEFNDAFFISTFEANGGKLPRGRCKALRATAALWEGTRKEFVDTAVRLGIERGTAGANYQAGYKK